jgi:hypothetical protein
MTDDRLGLFSTNSAGIVGWLMSTLAKQPDWQTRKPPQLMLLPNSDFPKIA